MTKVYIISCWNGDDWMVDAVRTSLKLAIEHMCADPARRPSLASDLAVDLTKMRWAMWTNDDGDEYQIEVHDLI